MIAARIPFGPQVFTPADAAFDQRVRESFARQRGMITIGAELTSISPGEVVIELALQPETKG